MEKMLRRELKIRRNRIFKTDNLESFILIPRVELNTAYKYNARKIFKYLLENYKNIGENELLIRLCKKRRGFYYIKQLIKYADLTFTDEDGNNAFFYISDRIEFLQDEEIMSAFNLDFSNEEIKYHVCLDSQKRKIVNNKIIDLYDNVRQDTDITTFSYEKFICNELMISSNSELNEIADILSSELNLVLKRSRVVDDILLISFEIDKNVIDNFDRLEARVKEICIVSRNSIGSLC